MIGAIVLAAGRSTRMGEPKLLLPFRGKPIVRHAVEAATGSRAKSVVVVTGHRADDVERELRGLAIRCVRNPDFAEGMSTSLRAGLRAMGPAVDAAVVLLADQPLVDSVVIDGLIALRETAGAPIVQPVYGDQPGNPVLWDRSLFGELMAQTGDQGGRELLRKYSDKIARLSIPDPRGQMDVDTPEAYEELKLQAAGGADESMTAPHDAFESMFCLRCGKPLTPREAGGRLRPACGACGWVHWADPKVATAVVIEHDGGLLLGRRAIDPGSGKWSFPAGYVDRGEVVEEAAVREVREELGVDVALDGLVGVYSTRGRPVILIVFRGRLATGTPRPTSEVDEVAVFAAEELPEMAFENDYRIVRDWLAAQ